MFSTFSLIPAAIPVFCHKSHYGALFTLSLLLSTSTFCLRWRWPGMNFRFFFFLHPIPNFIQPDIHSDFRALIIKSNRQCFSWVNRGSGVCHILSHHTCFRVEGVGRYLKMWLHVPLKGGSIFWNYMKRGCGII